MYIPHICMDEIQAAVTIVQTANGTIPVLLENIKMVVMTSCRKKRLPGKKTND